MDGVGMALSWLALVVLLGVVALPVTARLVPDRPSRGAAFAIPLGLAGLTLGTFWLGRLSFRYAPVGAVVLLGGVALLLRYGAGAPMRGRAYAEAAAVFTAGFGLVLGVQAVSPAITASGETYWNFALVQSLLRTTQLPPQDPWFAGEAVRYHYGGHLLVASLAELLDTPGRSAFALGKATVFGTLVTVSYGVTAGLAARRDLPPRAAGLAGGFVVGLASNLHTPIWVALAVLPDPVARPLAQVVPVRGAVDAGLEAFTLLDAVHFSFTNTDFPAYLAFIGGFHPHGLSPPFLLLLVGVLVAYWVTPAEARRRRLGLLGLTTPLVGLIALVNTWSLPTAGGLVGLTVALAPAHPASVLTTPTRLADAPALRDWLARLTAGAIAGVGAGAVGLLWVAPYVLRGLAGDPGLGLLPPRSGPWFFVIGYGGFLLAFGAYLAVELRREDWSARGQTGALAVAMGLVAVGWFGDFAGLALVGPILLGGLYLYARDRSNFAPVLLVAGAGLALLVELAYVREPAGPGRFNTVYKVYMQTWILWGPPAGLALVQLLRRGPADRWHPTRGQVFAVSLVLALSLYAGAGVGGHVRYAVEEDVRPSLDGLAYLAEEHPDHAAAIEWLAGHPGQPTIVSAPATGSDRYQFTASPAASLTGIPTVVGWSHEADYRGDAAFEARVEAVDTVYAGTRAARARALRTYEVRFIWVGGAERARYDTIDYGREPGITTAFQRGAVTVYRVEVSALATG